MLSNKPIANIVVRRLEPPYEKSGKGMPTTGNTPVTMLMLITEAQKIYAPMPTANTDPNRSRDSEAILIDHNTNAA